jgi:hypothetical protein
MNPTYTPVSISYRRTGVGCNQLNAKEPNIYAPKNCKAGGCSVACCGNTQVAAGAAALFAALIFLGGSDSGSGSA